MDKETFFTHVIDGYLLLDLRNMAAIKQKKGERAGAVSYAMIATIIPAMELLGGLMHSGDYSDRPAMSRPYFTHYWTTYLEKVDPIYKGFADIFYELIRHGTAHTFITKAGITVTKGLPGKHVTLHIVHGHRKLNVDCLVLYKDFKKSYTLLKRKLRSKTTSEHVEKNITFLFQQSHDKSEQAFNQYLPANAYESIIAVSSASGPFGPIPIEPQLSTESTTIIPN